MVLSWMSSCAHITDTIDFAKQLMKNGVTYVGYGVNFDEEILQNFERQSLILFFTSRSKSEDPQRWIKNNQVFFQQVLKGTKGWGYFAVDCDIYPERLPENTSSCVQVLCIYDISITYSSLHLFPKGLLNIKVVLLIFFKGYEIRKSCDKRSSHGTS